MSIGLLEYLLSLHQRLVSVRAVPTRWVEVPKRCPQGAQKVPNSEMSTPVCPIISVQSTMSRYYAIISPAFRIRRKHICKDKRSTCEKKSYQTGLLCIATLFIFSNKDKLLTRIHKVRFHRYILLLSILQTMFD